MASGLCTRQHGFLERCVRPQRAQICALARRIHAQHTEAVKSTTSFIFTRKINTGYIHLHENWIIKAIIMITWYCISRTCNFNMNLKFPLKREDACHFSLARRWSSAFGEMFAKESLERLIIIAKWLMHFWDTRRQQQSCSDIYIFQTMQSAWNNCFDTFTYSI